MAAETARAPRVLLTADTVGGVWTYATDLARGLAARGVQVHLATMGAPLRAPQRAMLDGLDVVLHESDWKLEWMDQPWDEVDRAGDWLLGLEHLVRPDLVHLNQYAFGALPWSVPTLLVAHSCVLSWWQAVHGEPAPAALWATYRRRVAHGLAGASRVAAPTRAMLATLAPNYGLPVGGCVLPNGRDPAVFRPLPKQPVVFAAGRFWDEAKNLAALDAVAPALPWPVRVAGALASPDGRERRPSHVRALGELPPALLAAELGSASIYCLPARYEPFGLSVLEAALAGCALVLGDIASLRETWGEAAVYVAPDDHAALRGALQRLVARPQERERLARAARARAQRLTHDAMAQACLAAYAGLSPAFAGLAAATTEEPACASSCSSIPS